MGGGCLLDFGIYCLQFMLFVMNNERPVEVKAVGFLNEEVSI